MNCVKGWCDAIMLLEGKDLSFRYHHGPWLFREIDVAIRSGEVVGLLGQNGCGKTTLGRILAGYDNPIKGKVLMNGLPLPRHGYCPVQMIFQHPERAVNPRWRLSKTITEGWVPDNDLLEKFNVRKEWLDRWPNELSGGELQRICIVRALGPQTRFLIADEITAMLDAITQARIFHSLLQIVRERNLGMLVISHDRHLIKRICDRIIFWENLVH
ncbi:Nickel-transporting ATPase [Parageobacillus thermoglucosidasius C56-YS93]|nr:Nickel-transporting ATPase [Parageobacillus thermoglucosidasius C56-YS93]